MYVAVQVNWLAGGSDVAGQLIAVSAPEPVKATSSTVIPVTGTLPVLETT